MLRAGIVAAALAILAAPACGHGGKEPETFAVRLKAVPAPGHEFTARDLDRSASIIRKRLEKLGVSGAKVQTQGVDVIVIELPKVGRQDLDTAIDVSRKPALLEFYDFEADLTGPSYQGVFRSPVAIGSLWRLLAAPQTRALAKRGSWQWYLFDENRRVGKGPVRQKRLLGDVPRGSTVLAVPRQTVVVSCQVQIGNCLSVARLSTKKVYYLFKQSDDSDHPIPEMTGADLDLSGTRADLDPQTNVPVVLIQFTERGKRVFHEITRREAERGALVCAGSQSSEAVVRCAQHFAIVLDHEIQSVPYIDFARNPDGIPGDNGAQIELGAGGSFREAKRLALAIKTGALPVQFVRMPALSAH